MLIDFYKSMLCIVSEKDLIFFELIPNCCKTMFTLFKNTKYNLIYVFYANWRYSVLNHKNSVSTLTLLLYWECPLWDHHLFRVRERLRTLNKALKLCVYVLYILSMIFFFEVETLCVYYQRINRYYQRIV